MRVMEVQHTITSTIHAVFVCCFCSVSIFFFFFYAYHVLLTTIIVTLLLSLGALLCCEPLLLPQK